MQQIDNGIRQVIKDLSYEMYAVQQYNDIHCTCVKVASENGDTNCPKCLGMGHKIVIKKIKGVKQSTEQASFRNRGMSEKVMTPVFFFDAAYPVKMGNLIVDGDEIYVIQDVARKMTDKGKTVYFRCTSAPLKAREKIVLENFHKIVGV